MRIDSHVIYSSAHPPEHLQAVLARNRFDGAILVGEVPPAAEQTHIVGWVAPWQKLAEHRGHEKLRGVWSRLEAGVPAGLEELARSGLTLDLEMRPEQLALVGPMAEQAPGVRMAIDHLARPRFAEGLTTEWVQGMEAAARFPSVFCKVSGLLSEPRAAWKSTLWRDFVQVALGVFGPDRVMFGSEWPECLPAATWKETLAAFTQGIGAQSMEVREKLLGGTAARFYGV